MTDLTRAQLAAIRAVLEVRLGWGHPLTQAIHETHEATEPEPPTEREEEAWPERSPASSCR